MRGSDLAAGIRCPACDAEVDGAGSGCGETFRCPACEAWLYRGKWPKVIPGERCPECRSPRRDGHCRQCGRQEGWLPWLRRGLLGRLWGMWRAGRELVQVSVRSIQSDEASPRLSVDLALFDGLRRSIEEVGLIQPLLLRPIADCGHYAVISGHRRLLAVRHLGWDRVTARILAVDEEEALRIRLSENLHREALGDLEMAEAFERYFLVAGSGSAAELGSSLGLDERRIGELRALLRASPRMREALIYGHGPGDGPRPELGAGSISELAAIRTAIEGGALESLRGVQE